MPFKKGETPKGAIPFKKGQSGNPAGKPPKIFKSIMQEMSRFGYIGLKHANIVEAYEILIGMPENRLIQITNDIDMPMLMRICAKSLLSKNGFDVIERMLDRAHGKAKQQTIIGNPDGSNINQPTTTIVFINDSECKGIEG
jgi:hypothetical protein